MRRLVLVLTFLLAGRTLLSAGEPQASEQVAERLLECTVTVRFSTSEAAQSARADNATSPPARVAGISGVTVTSGVSMGDGLIITINRDPSGENLSTFNSVIPPSKSCVGAVPGFMIHIALVPERLEMKARVPSGVKVGEIVVPLAGSMISG